MALLLAPMEGMLDFVLRDILTRVGGVDRCVSEFIRVTGTPLPERALLRIMPELAHGGRTPAGVPVRAQLLGSDAACMADTAALLAAMGSHGIDLNFGCPAKVVNRHGGGAALLRDPETLTRIVAAVRRAVPAHLPVSAKMRLGFDDDTQAVECAQAIAQGGASELVVHARTRAHGYRPPAYWDRVNDIRQGVQIAVVANGEIWSVQDAQRCREVSGCHDLMLGRGIVANPGLALAIAHADNPGVQPVPGVTWEQLLPHIHQFWLLVCDRLDRRKRAGRLKQWLNYLRLHYPQAQQAYQELRAVNDLALVGQWLDQQMRNAPPRPREAEGRGDP